MADTPGTQYHPDYVTPPGETLREVLNERSVSQAEFARRTGRPQKTISEIINGRCAITQETALQFELVLGISAEFWNAREQHYREYLARVDQTRTLGRDVAWIEKFPVRAMQKFNWIQKQDTPSENVREVLQFFGIASRRQWKLLQQFSLRKPPSLRVDKYALSAWLRQGERLADKISCSPFDEDAFRSGLDYARQLTLKPPGEFCGELVDTCAQAGVAVTFVPALPKSGASGATRWLSPTKALIQLSLRYKTDDQLWFTLFHEAAHILLHGKRLIFIEGVWGGGAKEISANAFAAGWLIPSDEYDRFKGEATFTKSAIRRFARSIGVAPGIVVGRLQHDQILPYSHCNDLKQKLRWA